METVSDLFRIYQETRKISKGVVSCSRASLIINCYYRGSDL